MGTGWLILSHMKLKRFVYLPIWLVLCSCTSGKLLVTSVDYQAIRTEFAQPERIPNDAKIAVEYYFNDKGELQPIVYNLTDEIMMIDQTKSFVILPGGASKSYYDSNVYTTTSGTYESSTSGTTFNLGAIASILGVGGPVGTLLGATSVNNSSTTGLIRQNSVAITDQPMVNIGPKGSIGMSKAYQIPGIGRDFSSKHHGVDMTSGNSPVKFSVCITYSADEGETFNKLVTNFYLSTSVSEKVHNRKLSLAFNNIYEKKPDALVENWYFFNIPNNIKEKTTDVLGEFLTHSQIYDYYIKGCLVDYQ